MQARVGDRLIYDNFNPGIAEHPQDPNVVYVVFTDTDNEETHMFPMTKESLKGYTEMLQTATGGPRIVIAGAHEMPNGARG